MPTQSNYGELYSKLRGTPGARLTDLVLEEIFSRPEVKAKQGGLSREQIKTATRMVHRVAQSVEEGEFLGFMTSGEIPAIKLDAKEMELLRGGINLNNYRYIVTIILSCIP